MIESNDHDLLIEIRTELKNVQKVLDNHLVHHFRYQVLAWGIALTAMVGLFLK